MVVFRMIVLVGHSQVVRKKAELLLNAFPLFRFGVILVHADPLKVVEELEPWCRVESASAQTAERLEVETHSVLRNLPTAEFPQLLMALCKHVKGIREGHCSGDVEAF